VSFISVWPNQDIFCIMCSMNAVLMNPFVPHAILCALSILSLVLLKSQLRFGLFLSTAVLLAGGTAAAFSFGDDSFRILRFMAYLFFAYLPATAAIGSLLLLRNRAWLRAFGAILLAAGLWGIAYQAFIIEPNELSVRRLKIGSPKIRSKIRVAFMSDIQSDVFGDNERRVWKALMAEKPDLILLGGDYTHEWTEEARQKVRLATREYLLKIGFKAPLGVVALRGNVDSLAWTEMFSGTGIDVFSSRTQLRFEGGLALTLLETQESFNGKLKVAPSEGFHLVLGHSPDYALGQVSADLMLGGHTHGGQVRIPWFGPLFTNSRLPRLTCDGESKFPDGRRLYVTRGAGLERKHAPRMRFLCPPEIVVLDLVPSGSAGPAS